MILPTAVIAIGDPAGCGIDTNVLAIDYWQKDYPEWLDKVNVVVVANRNLLDQRAAALGLDPLPLSSIPSDQPELLTASATPWGRIRCLEVFPELQIQPSQPSLQGHQAALESLNMAGDLVQSYQQQGLPSFLLTNPISKEGIIQVLPSFKDQTDHLTERYGQGTGTQMMFAESCHMVLVSTHVSLSKAIKSLTCEKIIHQASLLAEYLSSSGLPHPARIGVMGLNPHASEHGTYGDEEALHITPAIQALQQRFPHVSFEGPLSPDAAFMPSARADFDGYVCMYHDQGLIVLKALYDDEIVNQTLSIPFTRVSPGHGTAYEVAGTKKVKFGSFRAAFRQGMHLHATVR